MSERAERYIDLFPSPPPKKEQNSRAKVGGKGGRFVTFCYPRAFVSTSYCRCNARSGESWSFLAQRPEEERKKERGKGKKKNERVSPSFSNYH